MARTGVRYIVCAFVALLLGACGGNDSSAPPPSEGQATLNDAGGTVSGPDGVVLTVPPGAVAEATTFRIARDAQGAPALDGMTLVSPTYAVTPHGAVFTTAATLKLPYDAARIPAGATAVVLHGEPDGSWHIGPLRSDGAGHAMVDVGGLSWFSVGYCTPGDAGTFGFGIGDCPAAHALTLEYMDGNNVPIPAPRNGDPVTGWVEPYPLEINQPTTLPVRVTWSRPAGVNRPDTVSLAVNTSLATLKAAEFSDVTNAAGPYQRQASLYVDPTQLPAAGTANGTTLKATATAEYCWTGFIIGRGANQTVCWHFDTELRWRVHDTSTHPDAPQLLQAPANVDAVQGEDAVFDANFRVPTDFSSAQWQRWNGSAWVAATGLSVPATTQADTIDNADYTVRHTRLTLKAVDQARDTGIRLRLRYCSDKASGNANCLLSGEVTLGVLPARVAPSFTLQPVSGTVIENQTFDVTVTATGRPGPAVTLLRDGSAVQTCAAPGGGVFVTSCTYRSPPMPLSASGTVVCAVASNDAAHAFDATSTCATITVTAAPIAPVLVQAPSDQIGLVGGTVTFTASATGAAPLSYKWSFNGTLLVDHAASANGSGVSGSSTPQLTLSNVQAGDAGAYTLTVSNGTAPDATATAQLSVGSAAVWNLAALAGSASVAAAVDGPLSSARFGSIFSMAIDAAARVVYVIDVAGTTRLRKIDLAAGTVSTLIDAASTPNFYPGWLAVDSQGRVYLSQDLYQYYPQGGNPSYSAGRILLIDPATAHVSTLVDESNGLGPAGPIAIGADDTIYVADRVDVRTCAAGASPTAYARMRMIPPNRAAVVLLAGDCPGFNDGNGVGVGGAHFQNIAGVAVDSAGFPWVVDGAAALRQLTPQGDVTTIAGGPGHTGALPVDGPGSTAQLTAGGALAAVGDQLFLLDAGRWLRRYDPTLDQLNTLADLGANATAASLAGVTGASTQVFLGQTSVLGRATSP